MKHSTYWLNAEPSLTDQIEKIVLRESKRNNPAFRQHALGCLADFVELRAEIDMYTRVYTIVKSTIEESLDKPDEMDIDSHSSGPSSKSITECILANSSRALLQSINPAITSNETLNSRLAQSFELLQRIRNEHRGRKTSDAIYDAQRVLFENLHRARQEGLPSCLEGTMIEYARQLFAFTEDVEQTRIKAADAAAAMAPLARQRSLFKAVFVQELATVKESERSALVLSNLDRARKMLDG